MRWIGPLAIGAALFAVSSFAGSSGAQATRSRVIVVRNGVWTQESGELVRTPSLQALVQGADGVWTECVTVTGATSEGTFDAAAVVTRPGGPRSTPPDTSCALSSLSPARVDVLPMTSWPGAHFGPFSLGADRAEVAPLIGVDAATLPEATDARSIVRHGPYRLSLRNGWLLVAAAFLDELPGLAAAGATTIAPNASFEEVTSRLGLRTDRSLGRADLFEPDLPHAEAVQLASSRIRSAPWGGIMELDGRVLVFGAYMQRNPELHARLRSIALNHALATRAH